jgi:hypothetical protein
LVALLPAAYAAKHPGGDPAAKHPGGDPSVKPSVAGAERETRSLLQEQFQAIERNKVFFQKRDKFNQMLLRLEQKVPQNPQQAALIQQQIRITRAGLADINQTIAASRLHLLNTVPQIANKVYHLLNVLPTLAPNSQAVANFVLLGTRRQTFALFQLMSIVNQEVASQTMPGP